MTIEEYKAAYSALTPKAAKAKALSDAAFRVETESLYSVFYPQHPLNRSCGECWADAFALLILTDIDKLMATKESKFALLNGAILRDYKGGDSKKLATAANLTDDLAIYHLAANPKNIEKFSKYPDNWRQLVATWKGQQTKAAKKAAGAVPDTGTADESSEKSSGAGE